MTRIHPLIDTSHDIIDNIMSMSNTFGLIINESKEVPLSDTVSNWIDVHPTENSESTKVKPLDGGI